MASYQTNQPTAICVSGNTILCSIGRFVLPFQWVYLGGLNIMMIHIHQFYGLQISTREISKVLSQTLTHSDHPQNPKFSIFWTALYIGNKTFCVLGLSKQWLLLVNVFVLGVTRLLQGLFWSILRLFVYFLV